MVISSNYVRAMSTAKYFAARNNLPVLIDENFGERKFGINKWSEKPVDFEQKQREDKNYKIGDGESLNEVANRMNNELRKIVAKNENKKL